MISPKNIGGSTAARRSKSTDGRVGSSSVTEEQITNQLERILSSDLFTRAERLSSFLRYVVDQALQGKAAELKEYSIALAVFERSESFDNRVDPIVRVEAGRLRAKIREYYDTIGKEDAVWIGLRKRGYQPVFKRRNDAGSSAASEELKTGEPVQSSTRDAEPAAKRGTDAVAIAVLPLADLSPGRTQQYFCDALSEQIINALAKIRELRVAGRTSALQFKDKAEDVREIGRRLKVDCVLEGSVQKVDKRVRVNVQLLSAANGLDLWGDTYDRPLEDIFAIQDEITEAVVEDLKKTLFPDAEQRPERPKKKTTNKTELEAYNEYLKGLYYWNKRTESEVRRSIEHFEACVERDPEYAPAFAGLAACYVTLGISSAVAPREVMSKARDAALKALDLDAELVKAKACVGLVKALYEWDWEGAREAFEEAVQLNPRSSTAHHWRAIGYFCPRGDLQSALESMQTARQLNPASVIINTHLGLVHYLKREYRRAIRQFELAIELEPSFYRAYWDLGRTYVQDCNLGDAVKAFERAHELTNGMFRLGALGHCYGFLGREKEAREVLDQLLESQGERYTSAYDVAEVFLGLHKYDRMFEWLNRACDERSPWLSWIGVDPVFDQVRSRTEFSDLVQKIGLKATREMPAAAPA